MSGAGFGKDSKASSRLADMQPQVRNRLMESPTHYNLYEADWPPTADKAELAQQTRKWAYKYLALLNGRTEEQAEQFAEEQVKAK